MTNKLFYGDNLDVLREQIASESVDVSRSLSQDVRRHAKTKKPKNEGDWGD